MMRYELGAMSDRSQTYTSAVGLRTLAKLVLTQCRTSGASSPLFFSDLWSEGIVDPRS